MVFRYKINCIQNFILIATIYRESVKSIKYDILKGTVTSYNSLLKRLLKERNDQINFLNQCTLKLRRNV